MEVWSGSVNINTSSDLQIKLVNSSQRQETVLPKGARLSLHSLVNPALIPLYARAGPSVELHANTEETSEWLKARLAAGIWLDEEEDGEAFERFNTIQCPVGLLVGVDVQTNRTYSDNNNNNNVSDLLIYGILSPSYDTKTRPLSPPDSSSLVGDVNTYEQDLKIRRDLRIYAVPLATSYVQKVQELPSPPSSTAEDDAESGKDAFAHFLPDLRSPSPKRKRILSLFEGAAQHHRRVRQRGGDVVSRMMANTKSQTPSQLSSIKIKREADEHNSPALERLELRRARSLSLGGSHLSRIGESTGMGEKGRPGSSKSMLGRREFKPSQTVTPHTNDELARSQSVVPTPSIGGMKPTSPNDAPSKLESQLLSSSPPATAEALLTRNKDLITRTILTCMRLYGYNRKANRSTTKPAALVTEPSQEPDSFSAEYTITTEEEEFKSMYHATYRAATFALRHYLKAVATSSSETSCHDDNRRCMPPVLSKDTATDIIDGILKLFCDDQLKPGLV